MNFWSSASRQRKPAGAGAHAARVAAADHRHATQLAAQRRVGPPGADAACQHVASSPCIGRLASQRSAPRSMAAASGCRRRRRTASSRARRWCRAPRRGAAGGRRGSRHAGSALGRLGDRRQRAACGMPGINRRLFGRFAALMFACLMLEGLSAVFAASFGRLCLPAAGPGPTAVAASATRVPTPPIRSKASRRPCREVPK